MTASLVGVGVGPGDPELLTARALRTLREADRVFSPTMSPADEGRAESIVAAADPAIGVERLVFAIRRDESARAAAHGVAADRVVECLEAGERCAFITLGDPNIYSTFPHLAAAVLTRRPDTPVETVPGIMAFQDLAARSGTVVLDGTERLHLLSAVEGPEAVEGALADPDAAVVIYKGGRFLPDIAGRLAAADRLDGAVFGELLGLPGQRLGPLCDLGEAPAAYLASVIVPPARRGRGTPGGTS